MKIRKATKKDVEGMLEIIRDNSPRYPQKQARKEIEEMFSKSLHKPTYLVVKEGGVLAGCGGFIRSWVDNAIFNLFWINTRKEYQGKGIGKKIVKELIREIKKIKEKPRVKMITISTNIPAFYKKLGFKSLGKKYDGNYILMGRRLG